ncbi:MAG: Erum7620/ECH_0207 family putative T1SS effector [Ehrlichia sp.]
MRPFIIYKHPKKNNSLDNMAFVQDKFSFMAFIFTVFFTLYNKLWALSFISIAFFCTTYTMHFKLGFIDSLTYLLVNLLYMCYMALSYSDWYQAKLKKKGYKMYDIIFAENLICAKLKFKRQ